MREFLIDAISSTARLLPAAAVRWLYSNPSASRHVINTLNFVLTGQTGYRKAHIATGHMAGLRMLLEMKRQKYFWMGTYEPWIQDAIVGHYCSDMHMWDIGAFTGFHTLLMRTIAGPSKVLAIEPDPVSCSILIENLSLNGFSDVLVLPCAVGGRASKGRIIRVADGPSQTTITECTNGECDITTLDEILLRSQPPGLVKLDIEGAEAHAFTGASRLLTEVRPVWILETHGDAGNAALEILRNHGYRIARIDKPHGSAGEILGGGSQHFIATSD